MMKKIIYGLMSFSPVLALAQAAPNLSNINLLLTQIGGIIKQIIPIFFAIAIIYFFWGIITFIRAAGNPEEASKGKSIMIYGVIALTVMVSIYGLIGWLQATFGLTTTTITLPTVNGI